MYYYNTFGRNRTHLCYLSVRLGPESGLQTDASSFRMYQTYQAMFIEQVMYLLDSDWLTTRLKREYCEQGADLKAFKLWQTRGATIKN